MPISNKFPINNNTETGVECSSEFPIDKEISSPSVLSRTTSSEGKESSSSSPVVIVEESSAKNICNRPNQLSLDMSINLGWAQSPSCMNSYSREFYCLFDCALENNEDNIKPVSCEGNFVNPQNTKITTAPINISSAYNLFSRLINYAINGQLRVCRFRSICWRIFLGILPNDVNDWTKQLKTDREYFAKLNYEINPDPHSHLKSNDHPLSYHTASSWNKYFYALQVKRLIAKDVDRTFPNVQYFRNQKIREIMINLLYIYTEHQNISYEQGMHEILAPLLFVLHCDLVAFEHVQEMNLISSDLWYNLNYVMNREYFQADAYTMFAKVMNTIKHWYPQTKLLNTNNNNNNDNNNGGKLRRLTSIELPLKASMLKSEEYLKQSEDQAVNQVNKTTKLLNQIQKDISNDIKIKESNYFTIYYDHDQLEEDREQDDKYNRTDIRDTYKKQRQLNQQDYYQYMNHEEQEWNSFYFNETEHTTHNCSGYCFVEQIHKQLLLKHNAKLYKHLKHLDISPKLFGLRWVRLLFGHEFPLQDLLYIWDCIFAINNNLAFVPYIYLSMLLRLAPMLLKYEFSECLTLLMNYPAGIDVTYIVYLALHLYKPHLYDKPSDVYNHHVHNNDNTTATMTDDNNNNNQDIYSSNNNPDINSINHDDRNSNSEKIDNINNKNKGYDIFNSVLSLPSLSDKIKSKIKNTISVNRSISYHEAGSSNDFFSTSSSKFKQNKRSSMVNLLTLKKLEHLKTPNNNVQLLNKNENIFNHQKTNISCSSVNLSNAHNEEKFNKNYTDLYVSVPQLNNNNNTSSSSNTNNNFSIFDTISLSNSIDYGNKLFTNHYETESINDCEYYDMKVNNHSSTSTTAHTSLSSLSLNQISIMMKNSENDNSINSSIMEETIQPNLMDNFSKNATNSSSSMNIQDKNKRLHEKTYSLISNCIKSLSLCSTHMEIYLNNYVSQCLNKHHHDKYNGQDISSFPSLSPSSSFQFTPGYYTSYLPNQNSNCSSYYLQTFLPLSISSYSVHLYDYALFTNFDHLKYVQNEIKITLDNLIKFSYDHMDIPEELRHHKVNDESKHIDNNVEQSSLPLNSFYFTSH